jgi:hypothetical protein
MSGLTAEQRALLAGLVGEDIAREDEPAVEQAYADFRAGMNMLEEAFRGRQ